MPNKKSADVFISYKSEQIDRAREVKRSFEQDGFSCWMAPESIPGGSSYAGEIDRAISGCSVFVLILTDSAQRSI